MRVNKEWRELLDLIPGYDSVATAEDTDYFDEEAAQLALDFFPECLQFIEGEKAGEPFQLEPWQKAIVAALWGWKRADGMRRYREAFIYVPRKNGKSPFAAGLMLLSMFTDGEPGAQLYSAAADREQAALIFRHAAGMIAREPEMSKRVKVYRSFKSIEYPEQGSIFKALSSDADTKHGLGPSFVVVDELHAHRDAELVETLVTGTSARREPLIIYITTADYQRESICNQKHDYASRVRDGTFQDSGFLPVIYEAAPDDDWTDPEVWKKANPNLGVSKRLEYLERECRKAQAEPSYQNTFRRLDLNQITAQDAAWLDLATWDACKAELPDLTGRICYGGLDLSSKIDLTAFALVFPPQFEGEPYYLLPYFWLPSARIHGDNRDRVPLDAWVRDGFLQETPGNVVDYRAIRAAINELGQRYSIQEIAYDPHNATQIVTELEEEDGFQMVEHRTGTLSMSEPSKEFEKNIIGGTLAHDGNPVMRWNIGNASIRVDSNSNIRPVKDKATGRIDGVIAAILALSGAMNGAEQPDYRIIWI